MEGRSENGSRKGLHFQAASVTGGKESPNERAHSGFCLFMRVCNWLQVLRLIHRQEGFVPELEESHSGS